MAQAYGSNQSHKMLAVTRQAEGERRREAFMRELRFGKWDSGVNWIDRCCATTGVVRGTYTNWRYRYPDWGALVDVVVGEHRDKHRKSRGMAANVVNAVEWDGSFGDFRRVFLGREVSPWFHLRAVDAIEAAEPGSITLFLWPPGHAKTSLIEDYCTFLLCTKPQTLITVGSEKEAHSRKLIGLVKSRLEPDTPGFEVMRRKFGPFAPPWGAGEHQTQPWGAGFFNVYRKPQGNDRDYSMAALGMGGSVIGTRCDLLIADDPQSRKSVNRTDELVDIFRQDWLSRPMAGGSDDSPGKTVVIMNRVGDQDFAQKLMDEGIVDKVIRVRADQNPDPAKKWAWPEKYTDADYERMRRNVGPEAWSRNFLQIARPPGSQTFTKEMVANCANPVRSILHDPPSGDHGALRVEISCDPGYGICAVAAAGFTSKRMIMLDTQSIPNLVSPEQIWDVIEGQIHQFNVEGHSVVSDVVIEANAFQKGMISDERSREMRRRFGVNVIPHQTNVNKNDPEIGVPQMAMAMNRHDIDFPAWDEVSRKRFANLYEQLYTYRAYVKGSKLVMDEVMTMWFLWRRWRATRQVQRIDSSSFNFTPLRRKVPA
jgi:hypothetical protein